MTTEFDVRPASLSTIMYHDTCISYLCVSKAHKTCWLCVDRRSELSRVLHLSPKTHFEVREAPLCTMMYHGTFMSDLCKALFLTKGQAVKVNNLLTFLR